MPNNFPGIRCFHSTDSDGRELDGRTVAVVGYGNLGRAVALNLRDAGTDVVVGNVDDSYRQDAARDGFPVAEIGKAVAEADIAFVLLPDEVIPGSFRDEIAPALPAGAAVCFASGFALAYGLVDPPPGVDVLMIAPRMLGTEVRRAHQDGTGFFSFVSVEQDASGDAERRLLALAAAVGSLRRGAVELPARHEAMADLLVEQTFGTYLGVALQAAFQIGTEAGLPAEVMALELYMSGELSRTAAGFADDGFYRSVANHGMTAAFGGFIRLPDVDAEAMLASFRAPLEDVRSG
ncbi:MAG: NAD(P)-binding domain-containing protein, partial [Pseudonocardia sp.]|nr:NAD(P)-binding domain-containing protein [Pseudonocardia sp.]